MVISIVLVFPEFHLVSTQRQSQDAGVRIFAQNGRLKRKTFFFGGGTDFHAVPPLTNNTAKTAVGEDLVKIRPAVAEQSRQNKKKHRTATETSVSEMIRNAPLAETQTASGKSKHILTFCGTPISVPFTEIL